ncbi:MAG: hypothetical protein AAGI44_12725 [Pseudomonadota bacterium]
MTEAEKIKYLRQLTGAGLLECKKALAAYYGDESLALEKLLKRDRDPPEPEPECID